MTNTDGKEDVEFKCTFTCDDNSSDSNYEISWFFKTPPQFLYKTVVVGSDKKEAKKNLADLVKLNFRLGNTVWLHFNVLHNKMAAFNLFQFSSYSEAKIVIDANE